MGSSERNTATYLLSLSLLCLASAIVYFTTEFSQFGKQIPETLDRVERTSKTIGPVIKEVGKVRDLVLPILSEVDKNRALVPKLLEESQNIRVMVTH